MSTYCRNCGAQVTPDAKFCGSCGTQIQTAGQPDAASRADMAQGRDMPGPMGFIATSVRAGLNSPRQLLKNPKQLLPMLTLGAFWLVLSTLPALGINPWPVRFLSFLTFAQGGMYGGMVGAAGGVIGKAVFAYFVSALILPLFSGKKPFNGMGKWFKRLASGLAVKSANAAGQLALGVGLSLIVFNFLTGNASPVNSMAGVVGLVMAVRSLGNRGGFFWGLLLSAANKLSKGGVPTQMAVSRVMSGYAAGSAAGVALSTLRVAPYLPYALGSLLLIAGLVLGIASKPGKAAVSS
jgi:hypothetical protein